MSRAWLPKLGLGVRDEYDGWAGDDDEALVGGCSGGKPMLGGM